MRDIYIRLQNQIEGEARERELESVRSARKSTKRREASADESVEEGSDEESINGAETPLLAVSSSACPLSNFDVLKQLPTSLRLFPLIFRNNSRPSAIVPDRGNSNEIGFVKKISLTVSRGERGAYIK